MQCSHLGSLLCACKVQFYKKGSRLDHAWTQATALCAKGELYGVRLMKVSTAMVNPLAKDKEIGVLIMYSGNEQEAQETLQIGRNIVNKMKYESRSDYMYWKGDAKTLAGEYSRFVTWREPKFLTIGWASSRATEAQ